MVYETYVRLRLRMRTADMRLILILITKESMNDEIEIDDEPFEL